MGILRAPQTETAMAGTVPVPVASMMACSACSRSHRTVSPSDLWPNSRVSWKIRAAHVAGIRILRPRPSTFVCRSLVEARLAGLTVTGTGTLCICITGTTPSGPIGWAFWYGSESVVVGSSFNGKAWKPIVVASSNTVCLESPMLFFLVVFVVFVGVGGSLSGSASLVLRSVVPPSSSWSISFSSSYSS